MPPRGRPHSVELMAMDETLVGSDSRYAETLETRFWLLPSAQVTPGTEQRATRVGGSVPVSWLLLKSRTWSAVKAEKVSGMVPVRTPRVMARVVSAV